MGWEPKALQFVLGLNVLAAVPTAVLFMALPSKDAVFGFGFTNLDLDGNRQGLFVMGLLYLKLGVFEALALYLIRSSSSKEVLLLPMVLGGLQLLSAVFEVAARAWEGLYFDLPSGLLLVTFSWLSWKRWEEILQRRQAVGTPSPAHRRS